MMSGTMVLFGTLAIMADSAAEGQTPESPRMIDHLVYAAPELGSAAAPRVFGIDTLREPRLSTWAVGRGDLLELVSRARAEGLDLGEVVSGSRRRTDGVMLSWRLAGVRAGLGDGLVPFFIDWGTTPHPAAAAATGATLVELRAEHPDTDRITSMLRTLGVSLSVQRGAAPKLVAVIDGPRGRVELY